MKEDTLRSERGSARRKSLTEPTLLEMSGKRVNHDLRITSGLPVIRELALRDALKL